MVRVLGGSFGEETDVNRESWFVLDEVAEVGEVALTSERGW